MKIKTHPNHFDISRVPIKSDFQSTINRFNEILQEKMGISVNKENTLLYKDLEKVNLDNISYDRINSYAKLLDAEKISENVSLSNGDYSELIDRYFEGSPMEGLGKSFQKSQEEHGVNALFLSALAALESNRGESAIAQEKNNLFGFKAYDESPYSFARKFKDFESGIDIVAKYLHDEYLSENGLYYNGKSIEGINTRYATDKEWHNKIKDIIQDMINMEKNKKGE